MRMTSATHHGEVPKCETQPGDKLELDMDMLHKKPNEALGLKDPMDISS